MSPGNHNPTRMTGHAGREGYHGAGVYPKELVPACRPGDYVSLEPDGDVYTVEVMTAQPGILAFDSDDSSGVPLAANETVRDNEATELELPTQWMGQYRLTQLGADLPDDVTATIDLGGKQAPLYTNKNSRGGYVEESTVEVADDTTGTDVTGDGFNHHLTELYIYEDEVPYFTFEETGGASPTVSDLRFQGFQFRLEPASNVPSDAHVEPVPTERIREN